jgi:HipA-like protein
MSCCASAGAANARYFEEKCIEAKGAAHDSRRTTAALPGIPLAAGRSDSAAVSAVFDNLLPEGALRDYIGKQRHASTTFSMLREVAGDTAGGF